VSVTCYLVALLVSWPRFNAFVATGKFAARARLRESQLGMTLEYSQGQARWLKACLDGLASSWAAIESASLSVPDMEAPLPHDGQRGGNNNEVPAAESNRASNEAWPKGYCWRYCMYVHVRAKRRGSTFAHPAFPLLVIHDGNYHYAQFLMLT
jgi:hypothetical protein